MGQRLELGSARTPVEVIGWVEGTGYNLQGGLWVEPATWREAVAANIPDAAVPEGGFPVALVNPDDGVAPATVVADVEGSVEGVTVLTIDEAIAAIPGVAQQQSVFGAIIGVTFIVAGIVVALFFALLTIERLGLLGVLKAIGASSRTLAAGLTLQAVLIAAGAVLLGVLLTLLLAGAIPDAVPYPGRRRARGVHGRRHHRHRLDRQRSFVPSDHPDRPRNGGRQRMNRRRRCLHWR